MATQARGGTPWAAPTHPGARRVATPATPATPATRYVVLALEGVVAASAFGGGAAMIADPAGAMGLAPEMLDHLPVGSWLLPGMALIACNGVFPLACATAELRGHLWPRRLGHATAGVVLLAWPVTETFLFGYPLKGEPVFLRPVVAGTGVVLIALGAVLRRST